MIAINPHRYILGKFSYSFFERAGSLRGMENLLTDFILNPSFVHELFKIILDYDLKILQHLVNFPIDGVFFTDDWGSQRGLLMSPATWRKFIKPYMQRLYDQAHQQGYDVFIHSCGNNSLILDDLIEIGVNVFNPFQPEVINVEEVMQRYSHKLAFYGSLSIQHTLPFGTPDDVRREVEHRLRFAQQYGGLIISPAHDMPPDIPTENVLTMLNTLRSQ
jgi:uroporphyrinogen decarboxylase